MFEKIRNEETEFKYYLKVIGHVGEFFDALFGAVQRLGGTIKDVRVLFKNPEMFDRFAEVIMGKAKIVSIEPLEVINTTGRSEVVKVQAIKQLETDEERLSIIKPGITDVLLHKVLEIIEDRSCLPGWWEEQMARHGFKALVRYCELPMAIMLFSYFSDEALVRIIDSNGDDSIFAVEEIQDENLLKRYAESTDLQNQDIQWAAMKRIKDFDFINNLLEKQYALNPSQRDQILVSRLRACLKSTYPI